MTKAEALRRAAPVLAAMVRRDLERQATERAAAGPPAGSASPDVPRGGTPGTRGDLSGEAA